MARRGKFAVCAITVVAAAALGALSAMSGGCVIVRAGRYVEREEKRFTVDEKPTVWLSTFDGPIDIRSSDRHEVSVAIEKRAYSRRAAAEIEVHTEQTADHIVVDVRLPRIHRMFGFRFGGGRPPR